MSKLVSSDQKAGQPSSGYPTHYTSKVSVPLPSDNEVKTVMGDSFIPDKTLNVIKMFAGTEDLGEAAIGMLNAIFRAEGIDPKKREIIVLRSAKVLNTPYAVQANVKFAANVGLTGK